MHWWLIAIWSFELAWIVFWAVPMVFSNYHGARNRRRYQRGDYRAPNWAARVRDRQVYLVEHSFKRDQCLCFRCVPNKWKGDWTYARDRADRDHRGNPGANPAAPGGTLASSPSLGAAAQLAVGTSAGVGRTSFTLVGGGLSLSSYQWVCPGCNVAIILPGNGAHVQHSCPAGYSVTYQYSTAADAPMGLRHESLPRRKLTGVDYVMGFRSWVIESWADGYRLAAHNGIAWEAGQPAVHNGNPFLCPQSPLCQAPNGYAPGRACGYHAYDHWQRCPPLGAGVLRGQSVTTVNGICKMWGIIVRHGDGYRAQYAAPVALFRNSATLLDLQPIASALGLPLIDEHDPFGVAREHGYVWNDPLPNSSSGVDESGPTSAP